jgi:hypothetical protein
VGTVASAFAGVATLATLVLGAFGSAALGAAGGGGRGAAPRGAHMAGRGRQRHRSRCHHYQDKRVLPAGCTRQGERVGLGFQSDPTLRNCSRVRRPLVGAHSSETGVSSRSTGSTTVERERQHRANTPGIWPKKNILKVFRQPRVKLGTRKPLQAPPRSLPNSSHLKNTFISRASSRHNADARRALQGVWPHGPCPSGAPHCQLPTLGT